MSITVRRAATRDAAAFARIMGDPAVYSGLMQMPYPDEEIWRARLADHAVPDKIDLLLVAEMNGVVVGSSGLHPASVALRRRHALSLGVSVVRDAQGKGVGSALMDAMCAYADRWFGALRLELTVYSDNLVAIHLYRKFGFEIEGTFKGYAMRNGQYVDAHAMARFHPSPPTISAD